MAIVFLIGFLAIVFSASFISSNVYRDLKGKGNGYAFVAAALCFIVIFAFMACLLFYISFGGTFSRM